MGVGQILVMVGTRPEAIKLAPVIKALRAAGFGVRVCASGQHEALLRQALYTFEIVRDHDLALRGGDLPLEAQADRMASAIANLTGADKPDWMIVQGDTLTAFASSVAAKSCGVRLAHVEAGLRTGDLNSPWPEEGYRRAIARLANLHFAPTPRAADNLRSEGIDASTIAVTGNTSIDALLTITRSLSIDAGLRQSAEAEIGDFDFNKRLIFVTAHRRESHGAGLERIAEALRGLASRGDVEIVLAVHPSPQTRDFAELVGRNSAARLLPPLSYPACLLLMQRSAIILSDSGGIQEEAPALGVPVLVTRACTERPEAIEAGAARLVGTDIGTIESEVGNLLDDPAAYSAMAKVRMPFGDGHAAERIVTRLATEMQVEASTAGF